MPVIDLIMIVMLRSMVADVKKLKMTRAIMTKTIRVTLGAFLRAMMEAVKTAIVRDDRDGVSIRRDWSAITVYVVKVH